MYITISSKDFPEAAELALNTSVEMVIMGKVASLNTVPEDEAGEISIGFEGKVLKFKVVPTSLKDAVAKAGAEQGLLRTAIEPAP